MTNMPKSFQNSQAIETGLPDFHKMYLTVLKVFYNKHYILFNIEAIKKFQIKHLSMTSRKQFLKQSFFFQKDVDVTLKGYLR